MNEDTKTALKALIAFILRDISEAILTRLPDSEVENPLDF